MIIVFGVLSTVGGLMVTIIGYFLSAAMRDMREIEKQTVRNTTAIEVQKERFDAFDKKLTDMRQDIRELISEIKKLWKK